MYSFLITIHVLICFLMIAVILLQSGKGADIGAAFGGSSQTVFGSRGPGTFLGKATVWAGVIFMVTSLSLAILSKQAVTGSSILDTLGQDVTTEQEEGNHPHQENAPIDRPSQASPSDSSAP